MVLEHRHHLRLLLARGGFEKTRLVGTRVIHVRARERKVLEHEHPRLIRLFVELQRQHVGDDPDRVEVRLLGRGKIGGKDLRRQLVEPVRGRVAGTAQKHRAPVDAKAPAARTDVPRELTECKSILHAR